MPYTPRELTVAFRNQAGEVEQGVRVEITPHITPGLLPAVDEAAIAGFSASGVTNTAGEVQFTLIQSSDISPGLLYKAKLGDLDRQVSFHMPDNNANLHDILSIAETGGFIDPFEIPETFLELVDTPAEYGSAGQTVAIAADGSSLVFVDAPDATVHTSAPVAGVGTTRNPVTIPDGGIGNAQLALGSVTNTEIKAGTIEDSNIKSNTITAARLHADVRDGVEAGKRLHDEDEKAKAGQVLTRGTNVEEYTFAAPHGGGLVAGSVSTDKLANGSVTHPKLATDAVEAGNIKNLEVIAAKLGNESVVNRTIARGAVTEEKISDGQVDERVLTDEGVTLAKLAPDVKARHVPAGGTSGQALLKTANTDYAAGWGDVQAGGGGGGSGEGESISPLWLTHELRFAPDDFTPVTVEHYQSGDTPAYTVERFNLPVVSDTLTTSGHNITLEPGTYLITGFLRYSNDTASSSASNARMGAALRMFPNAEDHDLIGQDTYARWGRTSAIPDSGIQNRCVIAGNLTVRETTTTAHFALEVTNQSSNVDISVTLWGGEFYVMQVQGNLAPAVWDTYRLRGVAGTTGLTVDPHTQLETPQYKHKTKNLPLQTSDTGAATIDSDDNTIFRLPAGAWAVDGSVLIENTSSQQSVDSKASTEVIITDTNGNVVLQGDSATTQHGRTSDIPDVGLTAVNTIAGFLTPESDTGYHLQLKATNQSHNTLISVSPSNIKLNLHEARGHKGDKGDKGDPGVASIADRSVTTDKIAAGAVTFPKIDSQLVKQLLPGLGQDGELNGQAGQFAAIAATQQSANVVEWLTATQPAPVLVVNHALNIAAPLTWGALPAVDGTAAAIISAAITQGVGEFWVIGQRTGQFIQAELKRIPLIALKDFEPVTAGNALASSTDHYYLEYVPSNLIAGNLDRIILLGISSDKQFVAASRAGRIALDIKIYYLSPVIGTIPR